MDMTTTSKQAGNTPVSAHQQQHQDQHRQDLMSMAALSKEERKSRWQQQVAGGDGERNPRPQLEEALKCPRYNSSNTRFCYYNNYSVLQPRHFCKACRRYWTKGGFLRNIPVGGGCRKNKRSSSSSATPPSSSSITKTINNQNQHLVPTSSMGFPNILPTFRSTGDFELPHLSLPSTPPPPLSIIAPEPVLTPVADMPTTPSFMDIFGGGLFDNQSNDFYGPMTNSGGNKMDVPLPLLNDFGVMQQHGVVGDHHGATIGGATEGGQSSMTQHGFKNGNGNAAGSEGGQW